MNAMLKARQTALEKGKPVIVHANWHPYRIAFPTATARNFTRSSEELQEARLMDPLAKFRKILLLF